MSNLGTGFGARYIALMGLGLAQFGGCADSSDRPSSFERTSSALTGEVTGESSDIGLSSNSSTLPVTDANRNAVTVVDAAVVSGALTNRYHERPRSASKAVPPRRPNSVLYRGQGLGDPLEKKTEKDLPAGRAALDPSFNADDYRRRAAAYLDRWELEKEKFANLRVEDQEAAKAQLKREVLGQ